MRRQFASRVSVGKGQGGGRVLAQPWELDAPVLLRLAGHECSHGCTPPHPDPPPPGGRELLGCAGSSHHASPWGRVRAGAEYWPSRGSWMRRCSCASPVTSAHTAALPPTPTLPLRGGGSSWDAPAVRITRARTAIGL